MFSQQSYCQTFTLHHPAADEVYLACDCLGWFPMRTTGEGHWRLSLALPGGHHHVRYYVRQGVTTQLYTQKDVIVGRLLTPLVAHEPDRGLAPAEPAGDRDDAVRWE